MIEEKCQHTIFYETFLKEKEASTHAVISGLGLASVRVSNQDFLDLLLEQVKQKNPSLKKEELTIEGEYAYIRNRFLHYKPFIQNNVIGCGLLTLRIGDYILQYNIVFKNKLKIQSCWSSMRIYIDDFTSSDTRLEEILSPLIQADINYQLGAETLSKPPHSSENIPHHSV